LAPPALAGREDDLRAFDTILGRAEHGLASSPLMLVGLRGVGKTVLLRAFRQRAEAAGWHALSLEGETGAGAEARVAARTARELDLLSLKFRRRRGRAGFARALASIETFSVNAGVTGAGLTVASRPKAPEAFDFELRLFEVVDCLADRLMRDRAGLAVFVDEFQDLPPVAAGALVGVQHAASQRGWPFYVIGAGLPNLPSVLARLRSYTERYAYRTIGRLDDAAASAAVVGPAERLGVEIADGAARLMVAEARGYPFFLQTFAYEAWLAGADDRIEPDDAEVAISRGYDALEGFFSARWDRATRAEREVLRAMAEQAPAPSPVTALAARLGKPVGSLGPPRRSLIDKGLVYVPERGRLDFTALGMADWITRQDPPTR
jgi:hypothetical protein